MILYFQKHRNIAAFVKDLFKLLCNRNNLSLHVDDKASAYVPKPAKEDKQMQPAKITPIIMFKYPMTWTPHKR